MLRSMYAGISGMKNFQTKLDVIGNNIANVNTSGFKKGRVTFQEMMSQTTSPAQGSTANRGGINASQVGLGSQVGSIDNIHTSGFRQTTNNPLDLSIQGDGMFAVSTIQAEKADAAGEYNNVDDQVFYTRAGNFFLDDQGHVVNPQGYYLLGIMSEAVTDQVDGQDVTINQVPDTPTAANIGTIYIPDNATSFNIQSDGTVEYIDEANNRHEAGRVLLANFSNTSGLLKHTDNLYTAAESAGLLVDAADAIGYGLFQPEDIDSGTISNSLEMSNVDLSEEFTEMITAQRGFQANTRIITTSDEILQELVNLKR